MLGENGETKRLPSRLSKKKVMTRSPGQSLGEQEI
jgi:hypothetical protein